MIQLWLFGSFQVRDPGGTVLGAVPARPKHAALLAYLAIGNGGLHRRDRLTAFFWPDLDDERARNALSKALHHLRGVLGDDAFIVQGADSIGINPDAVWSDASAFEAAISSRRYADAIELFRRGELLEGLRLTESPEFDRWVESERLRFRQRAVASAAALVEEADRVADLQGAADWARLACELAPYDEVALRRRLVRMSWAGDRTGAVSAFQAFSALVARELEAEPAAETRALYESIRSGLLASPPQTSPIDPPALPASGVSLEPPARASSKPTRRRAVFVTLVIAAGILLAFTTLRPSPAPKHGRVLVAELENRTGDSAFNSIGRISADWITLGLQESGLAEVVDPLSTVMAARAGRADSAPGRDLGRASAIAARAGADVVVWGTVYRRGDSLLYQVQITDLPNKRLMFAIEPVTSPLADPIGGITLLRSRVAGALSSVLDARFASTGTASRHPPSFAAYQEYVRGLEAYPLSNSESIPFFEAASRLDPEFGLPLIWLAFAYGNTGRAQGRDSVIERLAAMQDQLTPLGRYALDYFQADQREDVEAKYTAAVAAARLSPGSEWSHNAANAEMMRNNPAAAVEHWKAIDPEHGWAGSWPGYWNGLTLGLHLLGRHEEELRATRRAQKLPSRSPSFRTMEARALIGLGQVDSIARIADELLRISPENAPQVVGLAQELRVHGHPEMGVPLLAQAIRLLRRMVDTTTAAADRNWYRSFLANALDQAGQTDEAARLYAEIARQDSSDVMARAFAGVMAARRGDRAGTESTMQFLSTPGADGIAGLPLRDYCAAKIALALGDREHAVALLRQALGRHTAYWLPRYLHMDPSWDPLRTFPPFETLVHPAGN